jgi:cell division protein FtsB
VKRKGIDMAANRQKNSSASRGRYYDTYVDGNTVRKIEPVYDRPVRKNTLSQAKPKEVVIGYEKREAVLGMRYTLFLVFSLAVILAACVIYMNATIQLSRVKHSVLQEQERLSEIQEENAALSAEAADFQINLEEIYDTATGELGMVYAGEDQIIYYDSSNSDYIRQFGEIPN